uniref:Uncharacterized protein n=1 Tax=Lepisosteus oculatus TaxID=7918 RepID=W5NM75_LEPOC
CKEVGEVMQAGSGANHSSNNTGNPSSKRHKELENAALQTSLNSLRMEEQAASAVGDKGDEETSPGSFSSPDPGAPRTNGSQPLVHQGEGMSEGKVQEEERTLTDHLNKRLLSSFLEKLNQRDLALPGIQRLDCAVAGEEDSNRTVEEW